MSPSPYQKLDSSEGLLENIHDGKLKALRNGWASISGCCGTWLSHAQSLPPKTKSYFSYSSTPRTTTIHNPEAIGSSSLFYHLLPELRNAIHIVKPETLVRSHRMDLRVLWR